MDAGYGLSELDLEDLLVLQRHYSNMATAISAELVARSQGDRAGRVREQTRPPRSVFDLDPLLHPALPEVRRAAMAILDKLSEVGGFEDPILERTRDGKRPRYFRLTSGRETIAYVWVQRDRLRIDLPLPVDRLGPTRAQLRSRDVQSKNQWKTSLYVRGPRDVESAVEAIGVANKLLTEGTRR